MYEVPVSDLIYTEQMDELIEKFKPFGSVHNLDEPKMYERLRSYLDFLGISTGETQSISRSLSLIRLDGPGAPSGCMLVEEPDEDSVEVSYFVNTGSEEAELAKNIALSDPAANAELSSDNKTGAKKVNTSIVRAKTFTKLKSDLPKTIREVKNVKKAERKTESMFDYNETVSDLSFIEDPVQEGEQKVKQDERISIEDEGILAILNEEAVRPDNATLKERKRKKVADDMGKYHNTLDQV